MVVHDPLSKFESQGHSWGDKKVFPLNHHRAQQCFYPTLNAVEQYIELNKYTISQP